MANEFFVGTCGWDYPHWKQVFYPAGIRVSDRLGWYAMHFNTGEVDATPSMSCPPHQPSDAGMKRFWLDFVSVLKHLESSTITESWLMSGIR